MRKHHDMFVVLHWLKANFLQRRDSFIYAVSIERNALNAAVQILGDVVLRPKLTDKEVPIPKIIYNSIDCITKSWYLIFRSKTLGILLVLNWKT